ncbi:hypothetical protein H6P81_004283 [Aristolochia fimbriata]|uniref:Uncharacterized protein n=1 Tax=Aristolochia fimbriata TaxID=158543 RepID=A0AAV7FHD0_ARIFI|nr:hypothetical protein H6P81_004283 [Aristolochia fimbriata]
MGNRKRKTERKKRRLPSSPVAISRGSTTLNKKYAGRVFMLHSDQIQPSKSSSVSIRSFTFNKVFEDHSRGILCYRDADGELICEGYDEGPRFYQPAKQKLYSNREVEIVDLLKQARLQMMKEGEFSYIRWGVGVEDDFHPEDYKGLY